MICNLPQHIRSVKMLTSGDESNLQICELSHRIAPHLVEPSRVFTSESNSGRRSLESDTCRNRLLIGDSDREASGSTIILRITLTNSVSNPYDHRLLKKECFKYPENVIYAGRVW
jgi:hypothetical protein